MVREIQLQSTSVSSANSPLDVNEEESGGQEIPGIQSRCVSNGFHGEQMFRDDSIHEFQQLQSRKTGRVVNLEDAQPRDIVESCAF